MAGGGPETNYYPEIYCQGKLINCFVFFSVYMFSLTVKPVVAVTAGSLEQAL